MRRMNAETMTLTRRSAQLLILFTAFGCGATATKQGGNSAVPSAPENKARVLSAFTCGQGFTKTGSPYLRIQNNELASLTNVTVVITVYSEDGEESNLNQNWPSWESEEAKTIDLPQAKGGFKKWKFRGIATLNGEVVLCAGDFAKPSISFDIQKNEGAFSHDVYCTFDGPVEVSDVDATLVIYYDKGEKHEVKRYWASLKPNEKKTINIRGKGRIERFDLSGSAIVKGKKEAFSLTARW